MGFRLFGTISEGRIELVVAKPRSTLGASGECDLVLTHGSVSRRHAELTIIGAELEITDLGSRNGTFVDSKRIHTARVGDGDTVVFGTVALGVREVPDGDLEPGLALHEQSAARSSPQAVASTLGLKPADAFATRHLAPILRRVASGDSVAQIAIEIGQALHDSLPTLEVSISRVADDGVLFTAARELTGPIGAEPSCFSSGEHTVTVRFPHPSMAKGFAPFVECSALLLALAEGRALPPSSSTVTTAPPLPEPGITDEELRRIFTEAAAVAQGDVGVLISGESGTGKEVLARYIHDASPRHRHPFIALNCAALPRDLLEAELFGIERGVATGVDARPGKFELATGGTLFLDEIGDMDTETQASILRVLQESEVYRVGGSQPRPADARVIAATNRKMSSLLDEGSFREDLYYRIATWEVTIPPLRHRRSDIPILALHFLDRSATERGVRIAGVSRAALEALMAYRWPGNVRQLQKEMERAALFVSDGGLLATSHLSPKIFEEPAGAGTTPLGERIEDFERQQITQTLRDTLGNVPAAANALGLGRSTLYRRIKALGIDPEDFEDETKAE